ncbi:citron Rho-interacting kinase [Episyrphus balteatus]|uniref:citron Rho-interacting kinase n=1 Tax=Episyrphus balteatus TaxID=286459 RepID=UPI0024864D4D|nr:citron Rho-interacting kinase [Episyrphus balteatus]
MSDNREPISVRTTRLNNLILGNWKASTKNSRAVADAISREGLLDAFCLLYNECDKDALKKRDKNISEFVAKYRPIVDETNALRVSASDFTVKTLIGKGYFGNVHLAVEKTSGDVYAMKKIKKSVVTTSQVKEERDIMSRRSSEWITNLQYAFQDNEYLYLVMEYLPGGDLLSLMSRNGPFDEDLARFYLAELTLAIHALHSMGYVHRDIKPENILIDRFGHIKLADFGNAAALNRDGNVFSSSPVGTPDYIAPELLETISTCRLTKSLHSVSCDFWSMGIIGYELICEVTPFHEDNVHETYSKILTHCEESHSKEIISFPSDLKISTNFKNLILSLVTNPSNRIDYTQIRKHPYFENIKWDSLRHQVPPHIPNVNGEDDTSNFDDIERYKDRLSTYSKRPVTTNVKTNEFSGKDLPFLGYSFIHMERHDEVDNLSKINDDARITKLTLKLKELQIKIKDQMEEINSLKQGLLKAEQIAKHSDSQGKILNEAKDEITKMKNRLKEKTMELAACKTQMKTLQSTVKIEEEMWQKKEATITELLRLNRQKYEEAKIQSEQRYEKQIAEKKNEIVSVLSKLDARDNELMAKVEECQHLQEKMANYKKMLDTIKEQALSDQEEFEKNKKTLTDTYEQKMIEFRAMLRQEKDNKSRLTMELRDVRSELNDSICSSRSNQEVKIAADRNIDEMKRRLNREIEANNNLRSENARIQKESAEKEKAVVELKQAVEKLERELQVSECSRSLTQAQKDSESKASSPYQTAHGSLTDLRAIEEQLRSDLQVAKENEDTQRQRADNLQEVVEKLEEMVAKFSEQPKSVGDMLEKQNEKLEDKLAAAREQMIVERQSARTANLNLWKVEKQLEDVLHEKKLTQRRMELTEEKMKKIVGEKDNMERKMNDALAEVKHKETRINELKDEIGSLKREIQKEHKMWEKAEQERMKEKSEVVEQISNVHRLEERVSELRQKLLQTQQKHDFLSLENKKLLREVNEEREKSSNAIDSASEIQIKLKNLEDNYERLKYACTITDNQLTEVEAMLEAEQKRNQSNQEKIDALYKSVREKDETITKLRKTIHEEHANKLGAEGRINHLVGESDDLRLNLEQVQKKLIAQQNQLIEQTNQLFETQEKVEVLSTDSNNLQILNENYDKEIQILKEENARILTELFRSKEDCHRIQNELKEAHNEVSELRQEIEELNGTLAERQNYYVQRDIKSEATLGQHKKLIDYLQLKVEDLLQKKKKTLADKIFGTSTTSGKKENISPNAVEASILYRTLQEELKREKQKSKSLQEQINKITNGGSGTPTKNKSPLKEKTDKSENASVKRVSTGKRRTYQTHRFELSLQETNGTNGDCIACKEPIMAGSPYWKCKECKGATHRKCRSDVSTSCDGIESSVVPAEKDADNEKIENTDSLSLASKFSYEPTAPEQSESNFSTGYGGTLILNGTFHTPALEVNCAFEMIDNVLLLGCSNGLFTYHIDSKNLVHIGGIDSVNCIAITTSLAKAILVGSGGEYLYQCDLRHLQTRSQSNACMKPVLESSVLDLPFANRAANEKWQLVKISGEAENPVETVAVAATSTRIVILKYDLKMQKFKPVRALDTATSVSSILFTRHTAIVSSDKFFEIDFGTYTAEEFVDLSDQTLSHTRSCQPVVAIRVSQQEFLLCFMECGVFVDEYGCRSRPYDVNWEYTPTGFMYRAPFLYISHFQTVQILRLHRSYTNEIGDREQDTTDEEAGPPFQRTYLTLYMPTLVAESEKYNAYVVAIDKQSGHQEVHHLDAVKAFKENLNVSIETISSLATCVTLGSMATTVDSF